jgi:hypothetical protein
VYLMLVEFLEWSMFSSDLENSQPLPLQISPMSLRSPLGYQTWISNLTYPK